MYKVKQAARILNIPISTLHYYEERALITPRRGENSYRYYSDEDIRTMRLILLMRHYHFSIDEIKQILHNFNNEQTFEEAANDSKEFFSKKLDDLEDIIQGYKNLIVIINGLPLMNSFDDYNQKKKETIALIDRLYKTHNSSSFKS